MAWLLQTPDAASPKLLANIIVESGAASKGGGAFAFASASGVKLLAAEAGFRNFLAASKFMAVVGMDAITDTKAIDELRKLKKSYPNFEPKLFLHDIAGSCFHPKTLWLKTPTGGAVITGSGNLTTGGLSTNWEALAVQRLSHKEAAAAEAVWAKWMNAHKAQLLDLDHPKVAQRAKANAARRISIKKALNVPETEDAAAEVTAETAEETIKEIAQELLVSPVLVAEVPRSGNRWNQVNFDLATYQGFFGVPKKGKAKQVRFHHVQKDGSLGAAENRQSVAVKSRNYRFEVGAAHGKQYPATGRPIVIFEKIEQSTFKYVLLMPGEKEHARIQKYLDDTYVRQKPKDKLRITITAGVLQDVWPGAPFFI